MTNRVQDGNGWYEIKKNPISKAGIFPYLGSKIGAPDPNKTYMVLRPPEELSKPETIESFKLLPWVDKHAMLGDPDNEEIPVMPAEKKGVEGTTGEQVEFEGETLYSNIKVFSERLKKTIDSVRDQLSAGYRCRWVFESGNYNGKHYDAIQRDIRGNHLALVDKGRMGADVAVLDQSDECHYFALDSNEEFEMIKDEKHSSAEDMEISEEMIAALMPAIEELVKKSLMEMKEGKEESVEEVIEAKEDMTEIEDEKAEDEFGGKKGDESKSRRDYEGDEKEKMMKDKAHDTAMDSMDNRLSALEKNKPVSFKDIAAMISKRNSLHRQLVPHVGNFACDEMDLDEVVNHGLSQLKLECPQGHGLSVLETYLKAKANTGPVYALDSFDSSQGGESFVDSHYASEA